MIPLLVAWLAVVQRADDGVLFQCQTNDARVVYLAGDFNDWARNQNGRITDPAFAMTGSNGVWRKVVKLETGAHRFKFNVNGEPTGWFAPDSITDRDSDGNAILRVHPTGNIEIRSARGPQYRPQRTKRGMLLQLYAPEAHIVYLAGDFNGWALNRDGLVFYPQYMMYGPGTDNVWRAEVALPAGRHRYQFVIDGDRWVADPNVAELDEKGHSILVVE